MNSLKTYKTICLVLTILILGGVTFLFGDQLGLFRGELLGQGEGDCTYMEEAEQTASLGLYDEFKTLETKHSAYLADQKEAAQRKSDINTFVGAPKVEFGYLRQLDEFCPDDIGISLSEFFGSDIFAEGTAGGFCISNPDNAMTLLELAKTGSDELLTMVKEVKALEKDVPADLQAFLEKYVDHTLAIRNQCRRGEVKTKLDEIDLALEPLV